MHLGCWLLTGIAGNKFDVFPQVFLYHSFLSWITQIYWQMALSEGGKTAPNRDHCLHLADSMDCPRRQIEAHRLPRRDPRHLTRFPQRTPGRPPAAGNVHGAECPSSARPGASSLGLDAKRTRPPPDFPDPNGCKGITQHPRPDVRKNTTTAGRSTPGISKLPTTFQASGPPNTPW